LIRHCCRIILVTILILALQERSSPKTFGNPQAEGFSRSTAYSPVTMNTIRKLVDGSGWRPPASLSRGGLESLSTEDKQTLSHPCVTTMHANQAYRPTWEGARRFAQHPCRLALTSTVEATRRVRVIHKFQRTKTTSVSFGKVLAIWVAPQTACADSRAGRESADQFIGGISGHAWNSALKLGAQSKSAESFFICSGNPPRVFQPGMFRSYARVVETSTDRVSFVDLPTGRL